MYHIKLGEEIICKNEPIKGDRIIKFDDLHTLNLDKIVQNKKIRYLFCKECLNNYFNDIKNEIILV